MGACYSKQGHESALTPKHKNPHSKAKPHKNGVAVKIEYTPVRPPDADDKIPDADLDGSPVPQDGTNTDDPEDTLGEGEENVAEEKTALLDNKGGVAPSDSGIESLSPSETDQSERVTSNVPNGHSVSKLALSANEGADKTSAHTYCSCGPRGAWNVTKHDANRKSSESAPVTPLTEEPLDQQNSVSVERVHVEIPHSKRSSRDLRHFDSEPSLELSSLYPSLQDVKTMQMDGREVVVIDVDTYGTIMEELAMLKMRLGQLTDFLQLQDQEQGGSISDYRERLDFSNTSSLSGP